MCAAGEGAEGETDGGDGQNTEVFRTPALKEFFGHGDDVFDLSWSGNLFLLSASRDKTCMLWHLYSDVALKTFKYDSVSLRDCRTACIQLGFIHIRCAACRACCTSNLRCLTAVSSTNSASCNQQLPVTICLRHFAL